MYVRFSVWRGSCKLPGSLKERVQRKKKNVSSLKYRKGDFAQPKFRKNFENFIFFFITYKGEKYGFNALYACYKKSTYE